MKLNRLENYELIDGKPYGSLFFGKFVVIDKPVSSPWNEDPFIKQLSLELKPTPPEGLEVREEQLIYREPWYPMIGTLAIKYTIWGRAWKVHKCIKKGVKKYKKVFLNGRRKKVKVF